MVRACARLREQLAHAGPLLPLVALQDQLLLMAEVLTLLLVDLAESNPGRLHFMQVAVVVWILPMSRTVPEVSAHGLPRRIRQRAPLVVVVVVELVYVLDELSVISCALDAAEVEIRCELILVARALHFSLRHRAVQDQISIHRVEGGTLSDTRSLVHGAIRNFVNDRILWPSHLQPR